jgi:DNA-binding HxlR family transcriptional regulator
MPLRSDWSAATCPIARSLDVVGDPWLLLVLRESFKGVTRFEQFRAALGIADNVLSRRLAQMVEAGLLRRSPYHAGNRVQHEYVLTDAGADLLPVLCALAHWGGRHRPAAGGPTCSGMSGEDACVLHLRSR